MNLAFLESSSVAALRRSASSNVERFRADPLWALEDASLRQSVKSSKISVDEAPELQVGDNDNSKYDAENARRIYSWLSSLSPTVAMDERLWAHLSHFTFARYMSVRWPVHGESAIQRRYLLENRGFGSLVRNGIARLWWSGRLTHDSTRRNPYELTEVLFLRQDIQVALLERAIGKSRLVRISVLEYLRDNQAVLGESAFGTRIQGLVRELNLLGGAVVLDALQPSTLRGFLDRIGATLRNPSDEGGQMT